MRMYRAALMAGLLVMLPCALSACADDEIKRPDVTAPLMPELGPEGTEGTISLSQIESSTPFTAVGVDRHTGTRGAVVLPRREDEPPEKFLPESSSFLLFAVL